VGNLKYDVPAADRVADVEGRLGTGGPVLLGASTHAPEERLLLDAFLRLREELPDLRCVIAPRKVARAAAILELARERSLRAEVWTRAASNALDVWVVDEMGLLPGFFDRADVVFVGGSLAPHGGHNILEPAAHGRAILVGPHVEHFRGVVDDFLEGSALVRLPSSSELYPELLRLLTDKTERQALGRRASELYQTGRGSAQIYARKLRDLISRAAP
jgi:3-deoxy-D-manno-octulosonic-acid transferase